MGGSFGGSANIRQYRHVGSDVDVPLRQLVVLAGGVNGGIPDASAPADIVRTEDENDIASPAKAMDLFTTEQVRQEPGLLQGAAS